MTLPMTMPTDAVRGDTWRAIGFDPSLSDDGTAIGDESTGFYRLDLRVGTGILASMLDVMSRQNTSLRVEMLLGVRELPTTSELMAAARFGVGSVAGTQWIPVVNDAGRLYFCGVASTNAQGANHRGHIWDLGVDLAPGGTYYLDLEAVDDGTGDWSLTVHSFLSLDSPLASSGTDVSTTVTRIDVNGATLGAWDDSGTIGSTAFFSASIGGHSSASALSRNGSGTDSPASVIVGGEAVTRSTDEDTIQMQWRGPVYAMRWTVSDGVDPITAHLPLTQTSTRTRETTWTVDSAGVGAQKITPSPSDGPGPLSVWGGQPYTEIYHTAQPLTSEITETGTLEEIRTAGDEAALRAIWPLPISTTTPLDDLSIDGDEITVGLPASAWLLARYGMVVSGRAAPTRGTPAEPARLRFRYQGTGDVFVGLVNYGEYLRSQGPESAPPATLRAPQDTLSGIAVRAGSSGLQLVRGELVNDAALNLGTGTTTALSAGDLVEIAAYSDGDTLTIETSIGGVVVQTETDTTFADVPLCWGIVSITGSPSTSISAIEADHHKPAASISVNPFQSFFSGKASSEAQAGDGRVLSTNQAVLHMGSGAVGLTTHSDPAPTGDDPTAALDDGAGSTLDQLHGGKLEDDPANTGYFPCLMRDLAQRVSSAIVVQEAGKSGLDLIDMVADTDQAQAYLMLGSSGSGDNARYAAQLNHMMLYLGDASLVPLLCYVHHGRAGTGTSDAYGPMLTTLMNTITGRDTSSESSPTIIGIVIEPVTDPPIGSTSTVPQAVRDAHLAIAARDDAVTIGDEQALTEVSLEDTIHWDGPTNTRFLSEQAIAGFAAAMDAMGLAGAVSTNLRSRPYGLHRR